MNETSRQAHNSDVPPGEEPQPLRTEEQARISKLAAEEAFIREQLKRAKLENEAAEREAKSWHAMNAFEKSQVITIAIQTVILLCTLFVALYIGLKQTEISSRQAEISVKQTEISKALLDIPFTVSVDVAYEPGSKRLNIYNKGQTNIYLWGSKTGTGPQKIKTEPRIITPGGSYYIFADTVESDALAKFPQNGELRYNLYLYLTSQNATKYVVTTIIFVKIVAGKSKVHTQTTSIKAQEW